MASKPQISIYTDASLIGDCGGWAFRIVSDKGLIDRSGLIVGGIASAQRAEMVAMIAALGSLTEPSVVIILTDSKWTVRDWESRKKGFKVPYEELWLKIESHKQHEVSFKWVKGHSGHQHNEACDQMAGSAARAAFKRKRK